MESSGARRGRIRRQSLGSPAAPKRANEDRGFSVAVHSRHDVATLLTDWRALYRQSVSWSPFSDPDYQMSWCATFVPPGRERIVSVRRRDSQELVAVLPLHETSFGPRRARVRPLHAFGAVYEPHLHELPELLIKERYTRPALAVAIRWLVDHLNWDWLELPLRQDQSWFEPRWASDAGLSPEVVMHKSVIPIVVLDLPAGQAAPRLKRNLRESLRRSRNRLARLPGPPDVLRSAPDEPSWPLALADLRRLHAARSAMTGRPPHTDIFAGTAQAHFLDGLGITRSGNRPVIYRLSVEGDAVAALLTFEAPSSTWIAVSGVKPEQWELNAVTGLQWEAVCDAMRAGREEIVFSTGVDTAKLRWSEQVKVSHVFTLVRSDRRSLTAFGVHWLTSSLQYGKRVTKPGGAHP